MWKMSPSWWEKKHREKNPKWLTGSDKSRYEDFFKVDFRDRKVLEIGVGTAKATKQIAQIAKELWAVDISHTAVAKAKQAGAMGIHLDEVVNKLPSDYFDIAVSYLVCQHLLDDDLEFHLSYAIGALSSTGILAIQFMTIKAFGEPMTIRPGAGTVSRTPDYFEKYVKAVGGQVIDKVPTLTFNNKTIEGHDLDWHGFIIGKISHAAN